MEQAHPAEDARKSAEAIWQYVVSLKSVKKRNNTVAEFRLEKLERSLSAAAASVGKQDEFLMRSLAEAIFEDLQRQFDGAIVPTTAQIRETTIDILNKRERQDIAQAYATYPSKPLTPSPSTKPAMPIIEERITPATKTDQTRATGDSMAPRRRRLNEERKAITHKFQVGSQEGYFTVGLYDDGQPGEIFITVSKQGSVMSGLMDAFATSISIGLQYGVPLKVLINKFVHSRFEPSGVTQNPNIPTARSIVDYIFRWMALKFLTPQERQAVGIFEGADESPDAYNADGARQSKLLDASQI